MNLITRGFKGLMFCLILKPCQYKYIRWNLNWTLLLVKLWKLRKIDDSIKKTIWGRPAAPAPSAQVKASPPPPSYSASPMFSILINLLTTAKYLAKWNLTWFWLTPVNFKYFRKLRCFNRKERFKIITLAFCSTQLLDTILEIPDVFLFFRKMSSEGA